MSRPVEVAEPIGLHQLEPMGRPSIQGVATLSHFSLITRTVPNQKAPATSEGFPARWQ